MLENLVKNATDCDTNALADNAQIAQFLLDEFRLYKSPSVKRDGAAIALSWFLSWKKWCVVVVNENEIRIKSKNDDIENTGVYYNNMLAADNLGKILHQIGAKKMTTIHDFLALSKMRQPDSVDGNAACWKTGSGHLAVWVHPARSENFHGQLGDHILTVPGSIVFFGEINGNNYTGTFSHEKLDKAVRAVDAIFGDE